MATSWNRSTPRHAFANLLPISPFSCKVFRTNADEDKASATPITKASSIRVIPTIDSGAFNTFSKKVTPPKKGMRPNASVQNSTCCNPKPKAYFDRAFSLDVESSKPCSKSRNKIPNSPKKEKSFKSLKYSKPDGPRTTPIAKKPRIGDTPRSPQIGTTVTHVRRNINASRPKLSSMEAFAFAISSTKSTSNKASVTDNTTSEEYP
mmetsp:Transcript_16993/g.22092  ORF Transcript_16993/g.22092 Transcript_16993/m.22092 type:complete len:206 (-) Transcript_16993:273-890(-)